MGLYLFVMYWWVLYLQGDFIWFCHGVGCDSRGCFRWLPIPLYELIGMVWTFRYEIHLWDFGARG